MVPPELQPVYSGLIQDSPDNDELKAYVKAADLLDAYLKCVTELSAGNREFAVAKKQTEASIEHLNMPEAAYFLEHLAPSLEKTLDELAGDPFPG